MSIIVIPGSFYVDNLNRITQERQLRHELASQLSVVRARLEGQVNSNAHLVMGLSAAFAAEPDMSLSRFRKLAKPLFQNRSQLRNIAAAPDFVIEYMFPVEGNEKAIGLDYRKSESQFAAVDRARKLGKLVLAGPINLVQGGQGFIARIPVFVGEGSEEKFWGVISAVIDVQKLYESSGLLNVNDDLEFALRGKDAEGSRGAVFYGSEDVFRDNAVVADVILPYGAWQIGVRPKGGWQGAIDVTEFRIGLLSVAALIIGLFFFIGRIYERKRVSDTRFSELIRTAPVGVGIVDRYGKIRLVNSYFTKLTGYRLDEIPTINVWYKKAYPDSEYRAAAERRWVKAIKAAAASGEQIAPDEYRIICANGGARVVEISGSLFEGGVLATFMDITGRKRDEEALLKAKDEAEKASQAKTEFLSRMSHELRTPLNAVIGFGQLLQMEPLAENQQDMVEEVGKAGKHLLNLINEVLDLAKIESGTLSITRKKVDLLKELDASISLIRPLVQQKRMRIESDIDRKEGYCVFSDAERIRQILINLLSNAVKYGNDGGRIGVQCEADDAGFVRITIWDDGPGISVEKQAELFTAFNRLGAEDTEIQGTGIGLVIVRSLVQMMGGTIGLDSSEGKGARFWFTLPLGDENSRNNHH